MKMDKDYLLEEVIGSLDDLKPFSDTLVIQSVNENHLEMLKTLDEAEMIVEHLASCIVALKKVA
jgi:hypothetical protein